MSRITLVKNAFANICRGGSSALVMLLTPPFLTRILSKDSYGTWLLILQLTTYISLLDFGIQTAVGRYIAHYNELGEIKERDKVVNTSLAALAFCGLLAFIGVIGIAYFLPVIFKEMPLEVQKDAQASLLLIGTSLAIILPSSVFIGIFVGLQRYDIPAWIIGTSKLISGVLTILIASYSHSIVAMAVVVSATNLLSAYYFSKVCRKNIVSKDIVFALTLINKKTFIEIRNYCFSLSFWTLGMILAAGMDTMIIAFFDYKSVIYYNVAMVFITIVVGIQNHSASTIIPFAATFAAKGEKKRVGDILVECTRYSSLILIFMSVPIFLFSPQIVYFWLGEEYVKDVVYILRFLIVAHFFRQLSSSFYFVMASLAKQHVVAPTILLEGCANFLTSIILVKYFGVSGVAIATIVGAFISLGVNFGYNINKVKDVMIIDSNGRILSAILKPLISVLPIGVLLILTNFFVFNTFFSTFAHLFSYLGFIYLLWMFGTNPSEKIDLKVKLSKVVRHLTF